MSGQTLVNKAWLQAKWSKVALVAQSDSEKAGQRPSAGVTAKTITSATLKAPGFEKTLDISKTKVLGFREWKEQKLHDALARYNSLRSEMDRGLENNNSDPNLKKKPIEAQSKDLNQVSVLENQLRTQETTIEILKDLTIVDYMVGYLSKFQDRPAVVQEFVASLSQEQAVELVRAYLESLKRGETASAGEIR